jgi:hypothetical protein
VIGLLRFVLAILVSPFRSNAGLQAENAALRQQVIVLQRKCRGRVRLTNGDRLFFVQLYRWFPSILEVVQIIRPETLVRWHRAGFRSYWRWKSRNRGGRPQIDTNLRALIRQMSLENPLWGAPRIHGELLKLGFEVAQSTVAKYMIKQHDRPSGQSWWTFLRNHVPEVAAMDLFVVPTLAFNLLYGFIIVRLGRRELVLIGVTNSPTADWIARQITEAFPWDSSPRYFIRDRDCAFGSAVTQRRLRTASPFHGTRWRASWLIVGGLAFGGLALLWASSTRRRCASPKTMIWSRHSRRMDPISRSAYPFCQGIEARWVCPECPSRDGQSDHIRVHLQT